MIDLITVLRVVLGLCGKRGGREHDPPRSKDDVCWRRRVAHYCRSSSTSGWELALLEIRRCDCAMLCVMHDLVW